MAGWIREQLGRRPTWMNVLMVFCAYMTFIHMPYDVFVKPVASDQEAWLGLLLYGWWAKATEPLHWAIYAAGLYGFWRMRRWMWPWAAVYTAQVALGVFVWGIVYRGGWRGWLGGFAGMVPLAGLAFALWDSRARFGG